MSTFPALLAFADGTLFWGEAVGLRGQTTGELVFNTAMTGYQEILTDPSYAGQIVTFTHPHIGNVGINQADRESYRAWAAGLVVREYSSVASNFRSEQHFTDWLLAEKLIGISGVDTRQLTHYLREHGSQMACISSLDIDPEQAIAFAKEALPMAGRDLTGVVSTKHAYEWNEENASLIREFRTIHVNMKHVVVYDFGVKYSILRHLIDRDCRVTVVPALTSVEAVLALNPDAIVLPNGPGDPQACQAIIQIIQQLLATDLPLLGICLGHQLLALAFGGSTFKMKFGHHGANHPVQDLRTGQVQITSQNHNFAVAEQDLPECLDITHRSLFDGTIQGLRHRSKKVMSVQNHPEAGPGPLDACVLFDEFLALFS
ncbi:MAG: glutamine-hydrolyzing carbamoyl-phosphate synthase small subunit [Gammaproteobacteria bacterium]|nr:glutamine-hydrolyzing carbamoyl-phosphate synthase small subunit [Gammaproteobacteria bacterium]